MENRDGIVVLGTPRSGTTLLRRLLNAHPNIACRGETFLLTAAARFLRADKIADGIDYGVLGGLHAAGYSEEKILGRLREFVFGFLDEIAEREGKRRWAEKTAIDSFYLAEVERLCAGHVRFIVMIRHGLDVGLSLQELCEANRTYIRELHEYIRRYPRHLEACCRAWAHVTVELLGFAERHAHDAVLVRYEDLVADPAAVMHEVGEFLGEEWVSQLISDALAETTVSGLGDWKAYARNAIDGSSVGRWSALSETDLAYVAPFVNPVLARCGYPAVPEGRMPSPEEAMRRYELSMMFQASRTKT